MATSPNSTQITPPRVPITDDRTGAMSREWYRWFYSLYNITGAGAGIIPVASGGTGLNTTPTNGQLLIGNGTGYALNTLGTGSGISVTNGAGTISIANTGVLSNLAGSGISVSSATGNVTISNTGVLSFAGGTTGLTPATATTGAITLAGTLAIANGGTNGSSTPTAGAVPYGTGTAYAFTAAGTVGQVLTSNGAGVPTWTTPSTSSGTVTSVGLSAPAIFTVTGSPVTTSGTLTLAYSGTALPTTSGGTGLTSFTANGVVYASSTSALATGSALTFDGTNFATTGTSTAKSFIPTSATLPIAGMYKVATTTIGFSALSTNRVRINNAGLSSGVSITEPQAAIHIDTIGNFTNNNYSPTTTNAFGFYNAGGAFVREAFGVAQINVNSLRISSLQTDDGVDSNTLPLATTLYIEGAPTGASLTTITNSYSLYIASGKSFFGGYITGDFSNATLSSRANFQSSTLNGVTIVSLIPNGTGTQSRLNVLNVSSTTNYAVGSLLATATDVRLVSDAAGTGTQLPMTFYTSGVEKMRLDINGLLGLGVTPVASKGTLQVGTISYTDTGVVAGLASSVAGYNQIILQNTSNNAAASTNFNISNDAGTTTTNYGEFGINSSAFTGTGSFSQAGNVYLAAASTDLVIGTYAAKAIRFVVNNGATDAITISSAGAATFNNAITLSSGGALSGTFTGTPTFSGAVVLSGTPSISNGAALSGTFTGSVAFSGNNRFGGTSAATVAVDVTGAVLATGNVTGGYNNPAAGTTAMAFGSYNVVKVTPNANASYTTTIPAAGTRLTLIILTSGTSSYTITFSTGFKTTGTLTTGTTSARYFMISFVSDGTNVLETARTVAIA